MLTLVPTPIGNLEDISYRSLRALLDAQIIFCEDTRVTKRLLNLLSQKHDLNFKDKEYKSYHSHNENQILKTLDKDFFNDKNIVYVSDAGMPCISDPGATLVDFCIKNNINYDVIPGANAVLTAFAMSGYTQTEFTFYGFLPHKGNIRTQKLNEILSNTNISILYESPHRLLKLLEELNKKIPNKEIFLVKEISKLYQKSHRDSVENIFNLLKKETIKGEWVIVIPPEILKGSKLTLEDIMPLDLPPKTKAKLIAKLTGKNTKEIYQDFLAKIDL